MKESRFTRGNSIFIKTDRYTLRKSSENSPGIFFKAKSFLPSKNENSGCIVVYSNETNWECLNCQEEISLNPFNHNTNRILGFGRRLSFLYLFFLEGLTKGTKIGYLLLPIRSLLSLFFLAGLSVFLGAANSSITALDYLSVYSLWLCFETALNRSITVLQTYRKMSVYFRLNFLDMVTAMCLTVVLDFSAMLLVTVIYAVTLGHNGEIQFLQTLIHTFESLIFLTPLTFLSALALALFSANYRDLKFIMSGILRIGLLFTPIVSFFPKSWQWLQQLSPFYVPFSPFFSQVSTENLFSYFATILALACYSFFRFFRI
jgi:hypothetical protein